MGEVLDQFDQMTARTEGRAALSLLGELLEDYEREVFATRGFGKWESLDPDTIAQKGSRRAMVDTGNLLDELTAAKIRGDAVEVTAGDAKYATYLRDGSRGMPKRDPAPEPTSQRVQQWAEQLTHFIATGKGRRS